MAIARPEHTPFGLMSGSPLSWVPFPCVGSNSAHSDLSKFP